MQYTFTTYFETQVLRKKEISEGVVLDYDSAGDLVGIDIDNVSGKVELRRLLLNNLPGKVETTTARDAAL